MLRKKNLLAGLSLVLCLLQSTVALAELKVGATAPSFSAPAALAGQTYQFVLLKKVRLWSIFTQRPLQPAAQLRPNCLLRPPINLLS